jgi:hypothetical protein
MRVEGNWMSGGDESSMRSRAAEEGHSFRLDQDMTTINPLAY